MPMGAATVAMVALPFSAISLNAPRMPITVPNRPMKGAVEPTVPRKLTLFSRVVISASEARFSERSMFSMPPSFSAMAPSAPCLCCASLESSSYPARNTREIGEASSCCAVW